LIFIATKDHHIQTEWETKKLPLVSTDFFKDCYLSKFAPEIQV